MTTIDRRIDPDDPTDPRSAAKTVDRAPSDVLEEALGQLRNRAPMTLLAVWAHPDDETYLSAALMHRIITAGGRVVVATATRGELGVPTDADPRRVGPCRELELRGALAAVGVHDLRLLGIPDGSCDRADSDAMALVVGELIDDLQPDVIITFGPDGITGHSDHIAVSRWVLRAWHHDPAAPLLLATMTDEFVAANSELHERIGMSMGGALASMPSWDLALCVEPTDIERTAKRAALDRHESQVGQLVDLVGYRALHDWWVDEMFRSATPADFEWAHRPQGTDRAESLDRRPQIGALT